MKHLLKLSTICVAILLMVACTNHNDDHTQGYTINGNIQALDGTIYLIKKDGKRKETVIDSTNVADGKFAFSGRIETPMYVFVQKKYESNSPIVSFFLENSDITIAGNTSELEEISVSGSTENDLYRYGYYPVRNDLEKVVAFVKQNPSSIAAAYVMMDALIYELPIDETEAMLNAMSTTAQNSSYLQWVRSTLVAKRESLPGKQYKEIVLPDVEGSQLSLSNVLTDNKYVLLNFWASWCPYCRRDNPGLVSAYTQFKEKGFDVFGVSLDYNASQWTKAIADDGLVWSNVSDLKRWECAPALEYGVILIPSNFLIDSNGIIVAQNLHNDALEAKLTELLGAE